MTFRLATKIALALAVLAYGTAIAGYMRLENVPFGTAASWGLEAMVQLNPAVGAPLSAAARDLTAFLIICGPGIAIFYVIAMGYVATGRIADHRRSRNIRQYAEQKRIERAARTPVISGGASAAGLVYDPSMKLERSIDLTHRDDAANRSMYAVSDDHHVTTLKRITEDESVPTVSSNERGAQTSRTLGPVHPVEDTRRKVVLVDDDPIILQIYSKLFQDAGVKLITATNGVDAFQVIETERPDVAILDYRLPLLSGIQLCEKARHDVTMRNMKIVLFTQDEQRQTRDHAIEAGADITLGANR